MAVFGEWRQICRKVFSWQQVGVFLILSVGLTLATVMFAIGRGYSSHSLPYKDAERLVMVGYDPQTSGNRLPTLNLHTEPFHEWMERSDLFADLAAFTGNVSWRLRTPGGNIRLRGYQTTPNFFDVLGVKFPELEDWKRAAGTRNLPVVLFTHGVGIGKFGQNTMGQLFHTSEGGGIIAGGILPASFAFPNELARGAATQECGVIAVPAKDLDASFLRVIGRLAPGITPQIVEQALAAGHNEEVAKVFGRIVVMPLNDIMAESSRPIVWGSWTLSGLVLILCAANLSGILLVHCSYRLREYALRTALGATFFDLARLLLVELATISFFAVGSAWFAGRAVVAVVDGVVPVQYLSFGRPVFGWNETVFLIAEAVAVAILGALAPLVVTGRNYLRGFSLGQLTVFHSQRWTRMLLTTGQVAIAMLLLSLSYMTVRGYLDIFTRDVGMDTSVRVVTVSPSPTFSDSMAVRKSVMENMLAALRGGNTSAPIAVYFGGLFDGGSSSTFFDASSPVGRALTQEEMFSIGSARVSPGFFRTAKIGILAGRDFDDQDRVSEVLMNAAFVRRMGWSPAEAVGQILNTDMVVIGVVDDFPTASWDETISMMYFRPLESFFHSTGQFSGDIAYHYIIHPDALSRIGNVERTILEVDPDAVITRNAALSDLLGESVRGQTFAAISVVLFTIAAIAIVVVGISNTVMFIVARRTRDVAIHIALGAQARHVCWFVVSDMVKAGIAGILAGGLASWWTGRTAAHLIHNGNSYHNLTGLALTSAAMILVIALASLLPALRALRIELNQALKLE